MRNLPPTLLALCLAVSHAASQSAGMLDPAFGNGGKVITAITNFSDEAADIALQPDGKIVLAGAADNAFGLARYLPDGDLDATFGNGGKVRTVLWSYEDKAKAIAIQPDGKIVAVGYSLITVTNYVAEFVLVRYTTTGDLDPDFGIGGIVKVAISASINAYFALAIQPDGKIIAACTRRFPIPGTDIAVVRLLQNGDLDHSFGNEGITTLDLGTSDDHANVIALQSDGKIVLVGSAYDVLALVRLHADGSLDTAFGNNGIVRAEAGTTDTDFTLGHGLEILPDGKIIALGTAYYGLGITTQWALFRFLPTGEPDPTFGNNGLAITDADATAFAEDLAIDADGQLLVAGYGPTDTWGFYDFTLARFFSNGDPDPGFGDDGLARAGFGTDYASAHALALQPNGQIIVAGSSYLDLNGRFAMARYNGGLSVAASEPIAAVTDMQVYPNPIRDGRFALSYRLNEAQHVKISLVDMQGRLTTLFLNEKQSQGASTRYFNLPANTPNGMYTLQMSTPSQLAQVKVVVKK
jgi:uncharacterized delta-60 repeat protein